MKKASFGAIIATFIICYGFWILLTWSFATQELIAGAIVSLIVACFSAKYFIHSRAFYLFNPIRLIILLVYSCVIFLWELIKANIDVAIRAYTLKTNPGIVKVEVDLESEYGQAMLANSITLTPGTITMDVASEGDKTFFYIHWIDVATTDSIKAGEKIKGTLEKWIRRIWK